MRCVASPHGAGCTTQQSLRRNVNNVQDNARRRTDRSAADRNASGMNWTLNDAYRYTPMFSLVIKSFHIHVRHC